MWAFVKDWMPWVALMSLVFGEETHGTNQIGEPLDTAEPGAWGLIA